MTPNQPRAPPSRSESTNKRLFKANILKIKGVKKMSKYRTPKNKRTQYVCRDAYGEIWMVLRPGENGVTESDIAAMHRADDDEWNNDYQQRRTHVCNPGGTVSFESLDAAEIWIGDDSTNPLEVILAKETKTEAKQTVDGLLAKLPPKQAQAVLAVWLKDMSVRDYAKLIGCSDSNVSHILNRAFENMRRILGCA